MNDFINKNKIYILPSILLVLNILAIIFHFFIKIPFKFELIPLIIGGFIVIKSTVLATIKKRKITAGMLVVLALIGTTYVGEYLYDDFWRILRRFNYEKNTKCSPLSNSISPT